MCIYILLIYSCSLTYPPYSDLFFFVARDSEYNNSQLSRSPAPHPNFPSAVRFLTTPNFFTLTCTSTHIPVSFPFTTTPPSFDTDTVPFPCTSRSVQEKRGRSIAVSSKTRRCVSVADGESNEARSAKTTRNRHETDIKHQKQKTNDHKKHKQGKHTHQNRNKNRPSLSAAMCLSAPAESRLE